MKFSDLHKDEMIRYSQHRLRENAKSFGAATATVDHHATGCPCGGHAPARSTERPTYDAGGLAEIANSLAGLGREMVATNAAFAARQVRLKARATADAAARTAGRLTQAERADTLRRSHAVADAAAAPNAITAINARAAEVWKRPTA